VPEIMKDSKNECPDIVEESAPTQTEEETAHSLRAGTVGALVTLRLLGTSRLKEGAARIVEPEKQPLLNNSCVNRRRYNSRC
jgi:hypothetical protein